MTQQIKITQLTDIGANLATTTLLPVVNMSGVSTTQKTNLGNLGNVILQGAGTTWKPAALANLAYSVVNAAQPNITSVGTLTTLTVSGNITGGNLVTGAQVIANGEIQSGTGFSTGGYLSVDGNTDLHNTTVTGNLSATGNITANAFIGEGSQLTNIPSAGTSGEVQVNWLGSFSNQGGTPGDTYSTLQFDSNGMPTLNGTNAYQQRVDYSPYLQVLAPRVESTDFGIVAGPAIQITGYADNVFYNTPRSAYLSVQDQANATQQWDFGILGNGNNNFVVSDRTNSNEWAFGTDGNTTFPDGTVIDSSGIYYPTNNGWNLHRPDNLVWIGSGTNVAYIDTYSPNVSVRIRTLGDPEEGPGYDWIFDPTGNLTLPTNTFSVNYANGQRVQLGGGSIASLANGTHQYTLQNDGSLLSTNNSTPASFVVNGTTPDIDLRNTSGTGLFTQSANVTIRTAGTYNWIFDNTGNLSIPGALDIHGGTTINFHQQVGNITWGTNYMAFSQYGRVETNIDFFANANTIGAQYLKGDGSNISNIAGANVSGQVGNALVAGTVTTNAQPNITSLGNLSSVVVTGNANISGNLILSNTTQIVSTPGSNGNITLDPDGTGVVNVLGNVVANNFSGNISITGNINGTSPNVTLVAGSYSYVFDNTGNFTMPANSDIIMTGVNSVLSAGGTTLLGGYSQIGGYYSTLGVSYPGAGTQFGMTLRPTNDNTTAIQFLNAAGNNIGKIDQTSSTVRFIGDGSQLSNVATTTTGSWTLAPGVNTVSLSVPLNGVYSIWVRGNIPNGIVTYTATAVVSNPNTPVVGSSYGWYYAAGNALVLTAIPTQFVGTVNSISNAVVSTTTANVFTFGITNNSGTSQVVNYGYTELG